MAPPVTVQSLPAIGLRSLGPFWSTCPPDSGTPVPPEPPPRLECGRHGVVIGVRAVARQLADHVRHQHGLRALTQHQMADQLREPGIAPGDEA